MLLVSKVRGLAAYSGGNKSYLFNCSAGTRSRIVLGPFGQG